MLSPIFVMSTYESWKYDETFHENGGDVFHITKLKLLSTLILEYYPNKTMTDG